jgi:hypothetical protein
MQFKSAFSRLVAFALLMLSLSMLACAAPAPVPAPAALGVAETGETSNSLVARADVSDQCQKALVDLNVKVDAGITNLSQSSALVHLPDY